MVRCNRVVWGLVLAASLALAACSSVSKTPDDPAALFAVAPNEAKLFVYAFYDNPDEIPWLPDTFRVHVEGGYGGDIGEGDYVDTKLLPGAYVVDADRIVWNGYGVGHGALKVDIKPGVPTFVAVKVTPDKKTGERSVEIIQVDDLSGKNALRFRKRVCFC